MMLNSIQNFLLVHTFLVWTFHLDPAAMQLRFPCALSYIWRYGSVPGAPCPSTFLCEKPKEGRALLPVLPYPCVKGPGQDQTEPAQTQEASQPGRGRNELQEHMRGGDGPTLEINWKKNG